MERRIMKKSFKILLILFIFIALFGCNSKEEISESALAFKQEYESFNNTKNEYFD